MLAEWQIWITWEYAKALHVLLKEIENTIQRTISENYVHTSCPTWTAACPVLAADGLRDFLIALSERSR